MVVLIAVEAVNDGLPGGNAARDHLLDDVRMVLLGQVLPGHQRQHIPQRHWWIRRDPGVAGDLIKVDYIANAKIFSLVFNGSTTGLFCSISIDKA